MKGPACAGASGLSTTLVPFEEAQEQYCEFMDRLFETYTRIVGTAADMVEKITVHLRKACGERKPHFPSVQIHKSLILDRIIADPGREDDEEEEDEEGSVGGVNLVALVVGEMRALKERYQQKGKTYVFSDRSTKNRRLLRTFRFQGSTCVEKANREAREDRDRAKRDR